MPMITSLVEWIRACLLYLLALRAFGTSMAGCPLAAVGARLLTPSQLFGRALIGRISEHSTNDEHPAVPYGATPPL